MPEAAPFKNDLLGRKESAEILTDLVDKIEGSCVLAVDAAWGTGKTTFLKIWAQHLRNQEFPVVEFNAWETDFSADPFVALTAELTEGLRQYGKLEDKIEATKQAAEEFLVHVGLGVIRVASAGVVDLAPLVEEKGNRLAAHIDAQELVRKFRVALQDMAKELSARKGNPLVVMIDELDRCRPSYAVELLEVAKHLFSVDRIVFVLAVNRSQLVHSITALYGTDFDAHGYLRRFFDVDFRLPNPERTAFIDELLNSIRIDDYFQRTQDQQSRSDGIAVRNILQRCFEAPELSLRQITQAIHRLGLVFASLRSDQQSFSIMAAVVLIVRTIDVDLYSRFARGQASDLEVVDRVFKDPGITLEAEARSAFARMIILAAYEISDSHQTLKEFVKEGSVGSPLLQRYWQNAGRSGGTSQSEERDSRAEVLRWAKRITDDFSALTFGFKASAQRIELMSSSLIDE